MFGHSYEVHAAPDQPASHAHVPLWHAPWPEHSGSPGHDLSEQSRPLHPAAHAHSQSRHLPRPEQPRVAHVPTAHDAPENPLSQWHVPL